MTCGAGHLLSGDESSPPPASLQELIFCWLLLGPFPEFSVADDHRPSDSKDSSFFFFFFFFVPQLYLWGSPLLGEIFVYVTVF